MPLSRISARPKSALGAFTYRELVAQRRLAERAVRRGRAEAANVLARIETELAERRARTFARRVVPAGVRPTDAG